MADKLLSIVLEKLASVVEQQLHPDIEYLANTILAIGDVLEDAERREVNDKDVWNWLEKVKDMAYQMDDVIDEWNTALLKLRIDSLHKKKVRSCTSIPSPTIWFKQFFSRRDIALKIKAVKQQLDVIESERSRFGFALSSGRSEERQHRFVTTSAMQVSEVFGRDVDQNTIVDHLLGRVSSCQEKYGCIYVISIVGAGGSGKTTLARLTYNHTDVEGHFDERIWVSVSDPFDPIRVCRDIAQALRKRFCFLDNLEVLLQEIQTYVHGKKFLLVLDEVWSDHQVLNQLKNALAKGAVGSRILVTSRKESIVTRMGTTYMHSLGQLPQESSQKLFHQIAFFVKSREKEEELKEIGEKIANKCKGLPLAIEVLGNFMHSKNSKEEWEAVLNSELWKLDVFGRDISPALLLSYYDLPSPIKRCFTFCVVIPKDSIIESNWLIKLWMAQGYLNTNTSEEMETVGREYFEYLAARSFFHDFSRDFNGNITTCKMHDLVHDFAQLLTKTECFIKEVEKDNKKKSCLDLSLIQKIHHAVLIGQEATFGFGSSYEMKSLRTLLIKPIVRSSIDEALLRNLFRHLTCLRALDLSDRLLTIKELPKEVGELIHLRYLSLSNCNELKCLPETICDLCNLQTLDLSGCSHLKNLPRAMGKLINLRHLHNIVTFDLEDMPKGIGKLESLQTLHRFIVSSTDGDDKCQIGDLGKLNNLRGKLEISGLDEVKDAAEAEEAKLKNKINLRGLLFWFDHKEGTKGVAEALQPLENLEYLSIFSYGDREWPNWVMMGSLFTQLKTLRLNFCKACPCLPPLGELPVLVTLHIGGAHSVKYIGDEFLGSSSTIAFPKLKTLEFHNMVEWKQWEVKGKEERSIMPYLKCLMILCCEKLEGLPDHVLQKHHCRHCTLVVLLL